MDLQVEKYVESSRRAELEAGESLFLLKVGGALVLSAILNDIAVVGLRPDWLALRFGYLPVAWLACRAAHLHWVRQRRVKDPQVLAVAVYCLAMIVYLCSQNEWYHSQYLGGFEQLTLVIALMPVATVTFWLVTALANLCYFAVSAHDSTAIFTQPWFVEALKHFAFFLLSVVQHLIISRSRVARSTVRWQLDQQIANQERLIGEQSQLLLEANTYRSIAATTQMLAHDVRKPFTLLRIGLDRLIPLVNQVPASRDLVGKLRLHVGHAYENVNGMLSDIMEVSRPNSILHAEPTDLVPIIQDCLDTVFRFHDKCNIGLEYKFSSQSMVVVDAGKLKRVISNILDNARQAMRNAGIITIATEDVASAEGPVVQVTLKNSNSYIDPEDQANLFTAFFTKGKADGTGLGLAICKKVVEAHGGKIWCQSDKIDGTSFIFLLPAGGPVQGRTIDLPISAEEIYRNFVA